MEKSERKSVLNSKRIKIIIGIVLIMAFSLVMDILYPVNGISISSTDFYDSKLNTISSAVETYQNTYGELPDELFGGDLYSLSYSRTRGNDYKDPLLNSGILKTYPSNINFDTESKRSLVKFRMEHPEMIPLFGKEGVATCNAAVINSENLTGFVNKHGTNPMVDQFIYHDSDTGTEYNVFIICDASRLTKSIIKHLEEIDEYKVNFKIPDFFSEFDRGKYILYGYNCVLVDGTWIRKLVYSGV